MNTLPQTGVSAVSHLNEAKLTSDAFTTTLHAQVERYHHKHPFHTLMNSGQLSRPRIRSWVANRFYYQQMIPIKDAAILSHCPDPAIRRIWVQRLVDHDGLAAGQGGIENWLRLGEAVGLSREEMLDECHLLPGVRFAVDAYVSFTRTHSWIEGVAASLTELFAPDLMQERIAAFERYYTWMDPAGLDYFKTRLTQAPRDASYALGLVLEHCYSREQQERAIVAVQFKCDLLWSMLDAIHYAPVEELENEQ